jgi:hypothetical protein
VGTDHLLSLACATAPKEVMVFGEE